MRKQLFLDYNDFANNKKGVFEANSEYHRFL